MRRGNRRHRRRRRVKKSGNEKKKKKKMVFVNELNVEVRENEVDKIQEWLHWTNINSEDFKDRIFFNHFVIQNRIKDIRERDLKREPDTSKLPFVSIPNDMRVVSNKKSINRWIRENVIKKKVRNIGVDTEFDAIKVYGQGRYDFVGSYFPDVIQLSTHSSILLIQIEEGGSKPTQSFVDLMKDVGIQKSFCNISSDYRLINNWFRHHGFLDIDPTTFSEMKTTKNEYHISTKVNHREELESLFNIVDIDYNCRGLGRLSEMYLGQRMKKDPLVTISRWSRKILSKEQMSYAADDPYVTLLLSENVGRRYNENREVLMRKAKEVGKIFRGRFVDWWYYWVRKNWKWLKNWKLIHEEEEQEGEEEDHGDEKEEILEIFLVRTEKWLFFFPKVLVLSL